MRGPIKSGKDKPCPVCYSPMLPVGKDFRCERHGLLSEINAARKAVRT